MYKHNKKQLLCAIFLVFQPVSCFSLWTSEKESVAQKPDTFTQCVRSTSQTNFWKNCTPVCVQVPLSRTTSTKRIKSFHTHARCLWVTLHLNCDTGTNSRRDKVNVSPSVTQTFFNTPLFPLKNFVRLFVPHVSFFGAKHSTRRGRINQPRGESKRTKLQRFSSAGTVCFFIRV